MSIAGKRVSTIGPGHDGAPKPGFYAEPGEPGLAIHHRPAIARGMEHQQNTDLPRAGKAKRLDPVAVHNGMVTRTRDGGVHLGGDAASYDANPANPCNAGPPRGKRLTPPMPSPGMRSRTTGPHSQLDLATLGKCILDQAYAASAPDDRAAHGYGVGALPSVTEES
jgi:hypothetical protein